MNDTDPGDQNGARANPLLEIRHKIDAGVPKARIVATLVSQGYTPEGASQTYEDILNNDYGGIGNSLALKPISKDEKAETGYGRMAQGLLFVLIGLVITAVTFLVIARPDNRFILTSGMLIIGGFWTLIGVLQWLLNRRR